MRRIASARAMSLLLLPAVAGGALADDPPLTLPGGAAVAVPPQAAPPPVPTRPAARPAPLFGGDPLRPAFRPSPTAALPRLTPPPASAASPAADDLPPMTLPAGPVAPDSMALPFGPRPTSGSAPPPLTLESTPLDGLDPLPDPKPGRSLDHPSDDTEPGPPGRAPRRFRLFGRPQGAPGPRPSAARSRPDSIRVEPRSDPAADAALKRRLEGQIRDAVGPHLRSLDVRVVDRSVTVRARVDRFWLRRSVRRSIESLPALTGYRASVNVDD